MKPISGSATEFLHNLEEVVSFLWCQFAYLSGSNAAQPPLGYCNVTLVKVGKVVLILSEEGC